MTLSFYSALLAAALLAQPEPKSLIEGTVVDAISGAPVARAAVAIRYARDPAGSRIVTATNTQGTSGITGDDGRFHLEAAPEEPFRVEVQKEGYVTSGESGMPGGPVFSISPGEGKRGVVLRLALESSISGRIYDPDLQKPVRRMDVQAFRKTDFRGELSWFPVQHAEPDESGRYTLAGLAPGQYRVLFQNPDLPRLRPAPLQPGPYLDYRTVYYPGVSDSESAQTFDLLPGSRIDSIDMTLTRDPTYCIRGLVRLDGPPQRVAMTTKSPWAAGMIHYVLESLPAPGPFEICHLPPGPIALAAINETNTPSLRRQALYNDVVVDKDIEDVRLQLLPGARVTFAVHSFNLQDPSKDPLWSDLRPAIEIGLSPMDRVTRIGETPTLVGTDGSHAIENVFFEPLQLSLNNLPDGWILRRLSYNGQPVSERRFELNSAAPTHHLEVLVAPAPNSLSGDVRSRGKAESGTRVLAVAEPVDANALIYATKRTTSDSNGRYTITHLVPGVWRIVAIPASEPWQKARDLLLAGAGEKVDVPESGSVFRNLDPGR